MSEQIKKTEFKKILNKTIAPSKIREALLDNEYLSDVIFQLADGEELRAHKMFLITSSPVFHKLFSDHKEDVIQIKLEWINKQTMLEVCRFIYSDILNLNETNMMEIWSTAIKLEMKYLKEKTIEFIFESLNEKTVFNVLQINLKHKDFRLYLKCFEYITNNPKKCLQTEEFLDLPLDLLKIMLQTCKLPKNLAKDAVRAWELRNKHEDIEELLSLNGGSDELDENSNDSDILSSVSIPSRPDASNRTKKNMNLPQNDTSRKDKKPVGVLASGGWSLNYDISGQFPLGIPDQLFNNHPFPTEKNKLLVIVFDGPFNKKLFKFANLEIEIMSKDVIIQQIQFINDLSTTDKEFDFWISDAFEHALRHTFNEKVSIEKLSGQFKNQYILPNKNIILKANRKYWIRVEFKEEKVRKTFTHYKVFGNFGVDRIKLILDEPLKETAQIITSLTFVDA